MFKLLICGVFLSIIGWFLDKSHRFTWLMKIISRDSVNSLIALDWLAQNPNATISPEHPGFEAILERWPNLNYKDSVRFIGRGPAYMQFGARVRADFGLEAKDENRN